ncbi:hypothetical protein EUBDOL_00947 [Amedibacillus dolichus DSM 3991]|uniref:Uncharacterized protein n=1 Tax=Amedibacillus dolichus DSM 3991 TaxID=428127 RepID=A8RAY0_9FIRM|nr:hypothetical protein EUBDOL_00947 [Amedibacillus dolichus DSM 3991]
MTTLHNKEKANSEKAMAFKSSTDYFKYLFHEHFR